jgi:molecular chaperone DnaK
MKQSAEDYLGQKVEKAVITVPPYFNGLAAPGHQGRRQDRRFGGHAHRQRTDAAALAYGVDKKKG